MIFDPALKSKTDLKIGFSKHSQTFTMTEFEARFFCCTEGRTIWYLGCEGRSTQYTIDDISTGQAASLIFELFKSLYFNLSHNPSIPLKKSFDIHHCVKFGRNNLGKLLIFLWAGNSEPKCEIIQSETHNRLYSTKLPSYCFDLSHDSLFFAEETTLFLVLVNAYLKTCTPEEHQSLTQRNKYLRFMLYQDATHLAPYSYGYLRNTNMCLDSHKVGLNKCPSDYLPCEMNTLCQGYFIFIRESKWLSRDQITVEDILLGD